MQNHEKKMKIEEQAKEETQTKETFQNNNNSHLNNNNNNNNNHSNRNDTDHETPPDSKRLFSPLEEDYKYQPQKIDYKNKLLLAPMNHLEFRLLCQEYGADIVYSEELIGFKLRKTKRRVNTKCGTVDFFTESTNPHTSSELVFRTCPKDHPNVLQMGVADPVVAVEAAQVFANDVDAIDINMGCPKHFSIQGGMGAALLDDPEKIKQIVLALKRNLTNDVTCKIRLHHDVPRTLDLLRAIESTGVSAIGVHGRYRHERPSERAHWDQLQQVLSQGAIGVPLLFNGDVFCYEDIKKMRETTGVGSVMVARGALANPGMFGSKERQFPEVMSRFLEICLESHAPFPRSRWIVQRCIEESGRHFGQAMKKKYHEIVNSCKEMGTLCKIFDVNFPPEWMSISEL